MAHPSLWVPILLVELPVIAILGTALLGNRELSERAFRLLRYVWDQPEPPGPAEEAGDPERARPHRPGRPIPAAHFAVYQSRPGRRALVIDDLADLRGPVAGTVRLPLRLFWSLPDHYFDLDDPDMRRWYYQTVLREASRAEDLASHLDAATLAALWPDLFLPRGVRRAWQEQHHSLRAATRLTSAARRSTRGPE